MDVTEATVLLIDDDAHVREAISRLLRSAGWRAEVFGSAQEFLDSDALHRIGCVVLDVRMPGMSGMELHDWLREHDISLPVIFLSGHCDVHMSVQAMKHGAVDVLAKPADGDVLLQAVAEAVAKHCADEARRDAAGAIRLRMNRLSARERQVMGHVIAGRLNKQIAADLGIAEKTVKVHRGRMMAKMQVHSVAALVHLCDRLEAIG